MLQSGALFSSRVLCTDTCAGGHRRGGREGAALHRRGRAGNCAEGGTTVVGVSDRCSTLLFVVHSNLRQTLPQQHALQVELGASAHGQITKHDFLTGGDSATERHLVCAHAPPGASAPEVTNSSWMTSSTFSCKIACCNDCYL